MPIRQPVRISRTTQTLMKVPYPGCSAGCSGVGSTCSLMGMPLRGQVEQGEEEDPDHVHEVPVEAAILQVDVAVLADAVGGHPPEHDAQHRKPCDDMQAVEAGHREIEAEENLLTRGQRGQVSGVRV